MPDTYINPAETGFYYLNSRYYDPIIGRFINADEYVSTGISYLGYNMFAYCLNNPLNMTDSNGNIPEWLEERAKDTGSVASAASTASEYRRKEYVARKEAEKVLEKYGGKCDISFSPRKDGACKVTNSYLVTPTDREKICIIIANTGVTTRTVGNMEVEWYLHNIGYENSPANSAINISCKDADIDYIKDKRWYLNCATDVLEFIGLY